jgi:hypothetical protein
MNRTSSVFVLLLAVRFRALSSIATVNSARFWP